MATSTITAPFTFDGAGTFCWQASTLGSYINSWNTTSVSINGTNITNLYMASSSYPAKIGGFWYITSAGNEETAEKGRATAINAIIGIIIIILSYVIISVVSNFVANPNTNNAP